MKLVTFAFIGTIGFSFPSVGAQEVFYLEPCTHGFVVEAKRIEIDSTVVGDQADFLFLNSQVLVESAKSKLRERVCALPWTRRDIQIITLQLERLLDEAYSVGNEKRPFAFIQVHFQFDSQANTVLLHVDDHGIFSPERKSSVRGVTIEETEFNQLKGTRVTLRASALQ